MERQTNTQEKEPSAGFSLKELLPYALKNRQGKPGPRISKKVIWLSEAIETETFWLRLNHHMAEDDKDRHSTGGIFTRDFGEKKIGETTWHCLFSSLDNFLKDFDTRALEFIYRDFQPTNKDRNLGRLITATRDLAMDKYPRLRRLYWEDYHEALESNLFWKSLSLDLENINGKIAPNSFFEKQTRKKHKRLEVSEMNTVLEKTFKRQYWLSLGQTNKKAQILDYCNFSQMIRDTFNTDPRTFLLQYSPQNQNHLFRSYIEKAKALLESKVSQPKKKARPMQTINKSELKNNIENEKLWSNLKRDIENHAQSQTQAYSFSNFLRHYNRGQNEIIYGRPGTYAYLATVDIKDPKNMRKKLIKQGPLLVEQMMWHFKPNEKIKQITIKVKALCAEMFQQDCLFVSLQTPKFWEELAVDLKQMKGKHTLNSFLRYYSKNNLSCSRLKHKKGSSKYQRYYNRAYHKQKEFTDFISAIGTQTNDFKKGLAQLFWQFAPDGIKPILLQELPETYKSQKEQVALSLSNPTFD